MDHIINLILACIATSAFYFLANYHSYNLGTKLPPSPPLHDFMHNILPDLSDNVKWRDIILPLVFIPLFLLPWQSSREILFYFIEGFAFLITLKAITIFFTFIPPSNPKCAERKQLNHCYHQMFSGHNSFVALLCLLYLTYIPHNANLRFNILRICCMGFMAFYSIFILMTRAHYTVDIIVSYIIVWLMFQ